MLKSHDGGISSLYLYNNLYILILVKQNILV